MVALVFCPALFAALAVIWSDWVAGLGIFGMQGHMVGAVYAESVGVRGFLASVNAVDCVGGLFNMFI